MRKQFLLLAAAAIILVSLGSCKKKLDDPGGTAAQKVAGEWFVTLTSGGADVFSLGHFKMSTYNTSANNNQIWVDDLGNGYVFKVKSTVDNNNLTFSATNAPSEYANPPSAPESVTIKNGKVIPNGGHSKSGNVVDSIYMEAIFSDDPTTTYVMSGHFRTGFFEDEY